MRWGTSFECAYTPLHSPYPHGIIPRSPFRRQSSPAHFACVCSCANINCAIAHRTHAAYLYCCCCCPARLSPARSGLRHLCAWPGLTVLPTVRNKTHPAGARPTRQCRRRRRRRHVCQTNGGNYNAHISRSVRSVRCERRSVLSARL